MNAPSPTPETPQLPPARLTHALRVQHRRAGPHCHTVLVIALLNYGEVEVADQITYGRN